MRSTAAVESNCPRQQNGTSTRQKLLYLMSSCAGVFITKAGMKGDPHLSLNETCSEYSARGSHFAVHTEAAITHTRLKARPLAVKNAARGVGVKVMPWIPPWLKRLVTGGRRITIDGNTLDATLQLILIAQRRARTGGLSADGDPEVARALMRKSHAAMNTHVAVPTTDLTIPGPDSPLRARHYRPAVAEAAPLLLFFHGGGFVVGDIESHDGLCRMICKDAAIHVLSVDYRLAPEHKAPAAVDDCVAAYQWARGHAAELGADPVPNRRWR